LPDNVCIDLQRYFFIPCAAKLALRVKFDDFFASSFFPAPQASESLHIPVENRPAPTLGDGIPFQIAHPQPLFEPLSKEYFDMENRT
jgi:hypothetical protein